MRKTTLRPHIREPKGRRPLLVSVAAHVGLLASMTLGSTLWQAPLELQAGAPGLPGSGSAMPVKLTAELTGGAFNVAPALTPAPEAVKPAPRRESEQAVELTKFADPNRDLRKESRDAPPPPDPAYSQDPAPGTIPAEARPGVGGRPGGASTGLHIGTGPGGGVAGWYVRQLEQRIARNWLKSSLGDVTARVVTRISFTIGRDGQIQDLQIVESSGNRSVDRAARRAIRASSPLPPLPVELRGRRVEFVAYFEYPPG